MARLTTCKASYRDVELRTNVFSDWRHVRRQEACKLPYNVRYATKHTRVGRDGVVQRCCELTANVVNRSDGLAVLFDEVSRLLVLNVLTGDVADVHGRLDALLELNGLKVDDALSDELVAFGYDETKVSTRETVCQMRCTRNRPSSSGFPRISSSFSRKLASEEKNPTS